MQHSHNTTNCRILRAVHYLLRAEEEEKDVDISSHLTVKATTRLDHGELNYPRHKHASRDIYSAACVLSTGNYTFALRAVPQLSIKRIEQN